MTTFDRQAVLDALSRLVTPGIKLTALADELGASKHEYAALRGLLDDLVDEGVAHVLAGGAYALAPAGRPADPLAKPKRPPKRRGDTIESPGFAGARSDAKRRGD